MNFSRIFLIIMLCVILVGCPATPMHVKVLSSTTKNVSIEVFKKDGWSWQKHAPKISRISFSKSLPASQIETTIWSIECNDKKYSEITHITYGELPVGFVVVDPIQPIHVGDTLWVLFWSEENPSSILGTAEIKIHQ